MVKFNSRNAALIVLILFAMSIMPGEGSKAASQQAIKATEFTCQTNDDCPVCVGSGLVNDSELNAQCISNECFLSDACLIWDCGTAEDCRSVKSTLLDNTVGRFNENPVLFIVAIGFILAFIFIQ